VTLADALTDVEIAFLQVEFSIKLLSYCELEKINPVEFDTDHVVLLDTENLDFPKGQFSRPEDIIRAAGVYVSSSIGASALVLDKAWEVAGIDPDPDSGDERVKLRTMVYMIRCAYAHGVADPSWEVRGRYRRMLDVNLPNGVIELDLRDRHGQSFDFDQLGGHRKWLDIRDATVAALTSIDASASL
jgi:hypothetical protein